MKSPSTIMMQSNTVPATRPAPSTLTSLRPRSSVNAIRMNRSAEQYRQQPQPPPDPEAVR